MTEIKYYKITNAKENHHGFQYKDGLNVDTLPFNDDLENKCCKSGLHFTTAEHLHKFLKHGIYVREVILPLDDPKFKMIKVFKDIFRANMIILGWKKSIFDISVIEEFKLYLNKYLIYYASKRGHVNVLEWFKNSDYEFEYSSSVINFASGNGHVNVLEWFKNSSIEFKYSSGSIDFASGNGCVNVLEWFKNSGYEFKYTSVAINLASERGHVKVLEWFKNSRYKFKYTSYAIDRASERGHVNVLEWFKNSGYPFEYTNRAIDLASERGHVNVLEWFKQNPHLKPIIMHKN